MADTPLWVSAGLIINGFAAASAAIIAAKNGRATAQVASDKLNFDLYQERYGIWKGFNDVYRRLVDWALNPDVVQESAYERIHHIEREVGRLDEMLIASRFIFGEEVAKPWRNAINAIEEYASSFASDLIPKSKNKALHQQTLDERRKASDDYAKALKGFDKVMRPYLDITRLGLPKEPEPFLAFIPKAVVQARRNWRYLATDANWKP